MHGSPRALTRQTCKRPRRCSTTLPERGETRTIAAALTPVWLDYECIGRSCDQSIRGKGAGVLYETTTARAAPVTSRTDRNG
jgi:hypothetical protein